MMTKFYWPKGQIASYMDLLYLHPDSFWQYLSSVYLHVYGDLFYYLISTITIYHAGSHNIDSDFIFSEQQSEQNLLTYEMTSNENENRFLSSVYDLNKNHSMWVFNKSFTGTNNMFRNLNLWIFKTLSVSISIIYYYIVQKLLEWKRWWG